jgi:hypothetical protein
VLCSCFVKLLENLYTFHLEKIEKTKYSVHKA